MHYDAKLIKWQKPKEKRRLNPANFRDIIIGKPCSLCLNKTKGIGGFMEKKDKVYRILDLYARLQNGEVISKPEEAVRFGVSEKSIQRDIDDIREFLQKAETEGAGNYVPYKQEQGGYRMQVLDSRKFTNEEVLAITKILLESRAFTKPEMMRMLDKMLDCCVPPENRKLVDELVSNERYHYIEPHHKKVFIGNMWEIGKAIREHRYIAVTYGKLKEKKQVTRKLKPLAIMFSEFYFYLAAHIENIDREKEFQVANDMYPTIYRIDRISGLEVLEERFQVPYKDRFEEGEYRKRIQFMFGGKLQHIEFWYKGQSVEAVLDKLPTAEIVREEDGKYLVRAETFGDGIDMWLRYQGECVELVKKF